jgi:hypothetical protein
MRIFLKAVWMKPVKTIDPSEKQFTGSTLAMGPNVKFIALQSVTNIIVPECFLFRIES